MVVNHPQGVHGFDTQTDDESPVKLYGACLLHENPFR